MNKKTKLPENYNLLDPEIIENPYEAYEVYRDKAPPWVLAKSRFGYVYWDCFSNVL